MQNGVLRSSSIHINRKPYFNSFFTKRLFFIFYIRVSKKIPSGIKKSVRNIRFSLGIAPTLGTFCFYKPLNGSQGRFIRAGGAEIFYVRKQNGQIFFRRGLPIALLAKNHRNRRSPIALARNKPVAKMVFNFHFTADEVSYFFSGFYV